MANIPPGLLHNPAPNTPTRPGVPLIAYYADVKQVSLGRHTPKDLIMVLLAVAIPILAFDPAEGLPIDFQQWTWQANVVVGLLLLGLVGLGLYVALRPFRDAMTRAKGPLSLSCEELKLTLPGRDLHPHWRDVYTVTCVRKPRSWRTGFRSRTYVRVVHHKRTFAGSRHPPWPELPCHPQGGLGETVQALALHDLRPQDPVPGRMGTAWP